jgi:ferric-dicitrate binding protein FerR (iron transport regulator)
MNEEQLLSFVKGEIKSESELIEILDWIEASDENRKQYNQLKNLWVVTGLDHPEEVAIPEFSFRNNRQLGFQNRTFTSLVKYAAIFILAFTLGSLSFYFISRNQDNGLSALYTTIDVPNGQRSQVTLYDGTKVWLNSGTKLRYPVVFSPKTRNVYLEGEAYFDVSKDSHHPFVVNAGRLQVKVLGTRFDVYAYPNESKLSATLEEGSVNAVNTATGNSVTLKPGEQVILNSDANALNHLAVNTELYTSWKENLLKFEDAPFEDVIKKMERWYDVRITVDPGINAKERYTMTIKTESLREMLQLISKTTKMDYEIKGNRVLIQKP